MDVEIRKAFVNELGAVQNLNFALFKHDFDSDKDLNLNWPYEKGENYFKDMISGKTGVCYVAIIDNKIVGYLAGSARNDSPSYRPVMQGELENTFVLVEFRSQGIGEKLARAFLDWCKVNGVNHVLVSAYSSNEKAIKFYKKIGFKSYSVELEAKLD